MAERMPEAKPTIECSKDGPYIVKGGPKLTNSAGDPIPARPTVSLCRCGASKRKPFCDGTHKKFGFSSAKLADGNLDNRDDYAGKKITIHDNRGICSHAGYCTDGLPKVWRMGVEPWIDPNGAEAAKIIETVRKCPSGALSYSIDEVEHRDEEREPEIRVSKDGPLRIRGGIELKDEPRGEGASLEHYTLCRCGASKNRPFCDGSHWYVDFKDEAGPTVAEKKPAWHRVADTGDLKDGEVRAVFAGKQTVALVRQGDRIIALDGHCPHQGGPLGEGTIEGGALHCPWHGWGFGLSTGNATEEDQEGVALFPVETREDGVYVQVEQVDQKPLTVSDIMVETMTNWGVTHVFGMVGHSNLGLAEAIRKQVEDGKLTYIGVRHEGAAAFAASGFAKASGRPAACLTIAGPGATNLLTGLWDAKVDQAPVLALTGQVNTQVLGPGSFQEIDLASAFKAVAAFSQTVLPTSKHAELMTLALKRAIIDRDVAHLIFPDEVQVLPVPAETESSAPQGRLGVNEIAPGEESLRPAVERIAGARRPVIIVGHGARGAMQPVLALAERLRAPVITTFKAKGQIPDDHPLATGVLGRSGTPVASWAMNEADLLIVFGASFSDHTGIARTKPIIQVDFERMALGKFHPVELPIWGEVGVTAEQILGRLPTDLVALDQRADLAERVNAWRQEKKRRANEDQGKGLSSAAIFAALSEHAPEDAIIAVDVGNNTYSFGRYFECRRQTVLMSGYLGSIGFGFPAAMGAWASAPDRPILAVCGDGGFGQYLGEFTTAVKYGMKITVLLLNNNELGKISKEQRAGNWPVWQTSLRNPDFAEYARLCGGHGRRVAERGQLDDAIREALAVEGPALVELIADARLV